MQSATSFKTAGVMPLDREVCYTFTTAWSWQGNSSLGAFLPQTMICSVILLRQPEHEWDGVPGGLRGDGLRWGNRIHLFKRQHVATPAKVQ